MQLQWPLDKSWVYRSTVGYWLVGFDILICGCFVIFIWWTEYHVKKTAARHDKLTFEVKEFSLMVKGLKDINREYNQEYLKIDIWNKIEKTTVEAETKLINDYKTATDPKQISSL